MRKTISAVLVALLMLSALTFASFADESGSCGGRLRWSYSGGTLTITGSGAMTDFDDSNLPPWFDFRADILNVVLPDGITRVGNMAFFQCSSLVAVSMPRTVDSVGEYAFAECPSIRSVSLSGVLSSIEEGAFSECSSLGAIQLPSTLRKLGTKAFYRCGALRAITIPKSVTKLGVQTFAYCDGLIRATVNAQIDTLSTWAFYGCSNLVSVSLSPTIVNTGPGAFKGCNNLEAVYTQSGNYEIADELDEQISETNPYFAENGYVASYDQPASTSVILNENGEILQSLPMQDPDDPTGSGTVSEYSTVKAYESAQAGVVVTEKIRQASGEAPDQFQKTIVNVTVEASIFSQNGMEYVRDIAVGELESKKANNVSVSVIIHLGGTKVTSEDLMLFAGRALTVTLVTSTGVRWQIEASDLKQADLSGEYELDVVTLRTDDLIEKLNSMGAYTIRFSGTVDFPATVGIPLPGTRLTAAALFADTESDAILKVLVDRDSIVWLPLEKVVEGDEMVIGINVLDTHANQVIIPKSMYSGFFDEDYSGLMDSAGNKYSVGDRKSKFGITGGQFAVFVGMGMLLMIVVVSAIMITRNHMQKSRAAARAGRRPDETIHDKILRDILVEAKDKQEAENGKKRKMKKRKKLSD